MFQNSSVRNSFAEWFCPLQNYWPDHTNGSVGDNTRHLFKQLLPQPPSLVGSWEEVTAPPLPSPRKQQSYSPLRIPFSTMGSEVSPRSHLMSSQLMVASMASATYTASPLSSPKSFPEENARSLLEKFFNLKWQKTQENSLRKICRSHAQSQMPAFNIPKLKLCCTANPRSKTSWSQHVRSQSSVSQNLWLTKYLIISISTGSLMSLATKAFLSFCDGFVMALGQVSLAQGNSPTLAKEIWLGFVVF